ncbi:TetR/AcrR family transcriptional regulator [Paenibacillus ginsengarvi]|uniref:TetR/AcrR family transcriptional regulator n=1 Tax=Paenibacillus ginsengarvi TaxID=400777 RepID=A0A3B0AVT9_9BACL|nr:TetR/AcrR family transcriptional regulator [Paenibacillus ginsengarvi]
MGQTYCKARTEERIVETAIRLFAEKGYSNTSTAEIAKAADVSEASLFKQYGTKDKLLLALIVPHGTATAENGGKIKSPAPGSRIGIPETAPA